MPAIRERLGNDTAAHRADLGRAVGINSDHLTTGARSLVVEHHQELRPRRVAHALAHLTAAEAVHVQVLVGDQAKFVDQPMRQLVLEVPAPVGNALVQLSDLARTTRIAWPGKRTADRMP